MANRGGGGDVVVAAGTDAHTALVLACVEAGLPTLCEKPVAPSGAEGAELLRRLRGSTVPVQIGFQRRFDAAIAAAKAAVDAGELGFLTTVRSTTTATSGSGRTTARHGSIPAFRSWQR